MMSQGKKKRNSTKELQLSYYFRFSNALTCMRAVYLYFSGTVYLCTVWDCVYVYCLGTVYLYCLGNGDCVLFVYENCVSIYSLETVYLSIRMETLFLKYADRNYFYQYRSTKTICQQSDGIQKMSRGGK